ncbi:MULTISPECIES: hypothetical protein [Bradyrhizobium]|jgi:hypothetical protein|uniref:Uncharacterized protein n=1 Tax=Bradyrhizobium elkanii TaxID=29448 RepID=A0A8I1YBQ3_BRAEL|nr:MULTISPECIES: hypothetical protein [Bradyrhizobium]MBP1296998.1 hypothetical protein [Bradyrhizobium elkanii]MCS3449971.1 hypothetical protein [Bradyrhizobium elkanii]MCS3558884.1 hypothetical protein [Bradyrhizobium elkanii]MCS3890494.1 hypothetical protein [Bradyrhizobium elkanii]MCS4219906.1 hypothetical protein [Bradyrhizobium elkanii]
MPDKAAAYVELALWGISISEGPASSLRQWWADERAHREDYGLTQDQIDTLVEACRVKVEQLQRDDRPRPQPKPRSTNQRARQGSLI